MRVVRAEPGGLARPHDFLRAIDREGERAVEHDEQTLGVGMMVQAGDGVGLVADDHGMAALRVRRCGIDEIEPRLLLLRHCDHRGVFPRGDVHGPAKAGAAVRLRRRDDPDQLGRRRAGVVERELRALLDGGKGLGTQAVALRAGGQLGRTGKAEQIAIAAGRHRGGKALARRDAHELGRHLARARRDRRPRDAVGGVLHRRLGKVYDVAHGRLLLPFVLSRPVSIDDCGATCATSPRLRGEVDLRAEHLRSEANRVRGHLDKLDSRPRPLARIPSLRFAALGIRPLPARGERCSKWGVSSQATTFFTAAAILSGVGLTKASWVGAAETGASGRATRMIGAFSEAKPCSATMAEISDATPHDSRVSSATTKRPVRATEARMVSRSNGTSVRGSITSTSMPSRASASAASSATETVSDVATTVASRPVRLISAWPNGMA